VFEVVRSYLSKFWQMSSEERDCVLMFWSKSTQRPFLNFDVCANFELFSAETSGKELYLVNLLCNRYLNPECTSRLLVET
jgi:hypothetical protein